MPWIEQARLLLRKAEQDAVVVRRSIGDPDIVDEIAGFHAQQACEKAIKSVLCTHGVTYERTHNLQLLLNLALDAGVTAPPDIADILEWSPFAVSYRYEDWLAPEPVDRNRAAKAAELATAWADSCLPEEPTVERSE